jgi:ornithine cyclodeaminase/alanine dehydrogenase-like protein (mu-crystallin family)
VTLVLSRADVEQLLDVRQCIDALRDAHIAFSRGETIMPLRLVTRLRETGLHAVMPAWIDAGPILAVKSIGSFPANASRGIPVVSSTVLLLDADTGLTKAVMDGAYLTAVRTAAASALAAEVLARADAGRLALIGSGVQAEGHLDAIAAVRELESVSVASRSPASAQLFVDRQSTRFPGITFRAAVSNDEAVGNADLVCTVTSSQEPVFDPGSIGPGTHISAVGSHTPQAREIPGETMRDARVVVDSREASLRECGDCMIPIADGLFGPDHVSDELGEVLMGVTPGRLSEAQVTIYQSCGIAIQDAAAANLVYENARAAGIGWQVDLH